MTNARLISVEKVRSFIDPSLQITNIFVGCHRCLLPAASFHILQERLMKAVLRYKSFAIYF